MNSREFIIFGEGGASMDTIKEAAIETIKRLPDDCSLDDIMYEINFIAQVLDGLKDAEEGKLLTTEELLKRIEQWAK
jgi:predicted transcriptional regulator